MPAVAFVLAARVAAFAQAPAAGPGSPAPPAAAAPRPAVNAGALDGSIRLDGRLDEALWQQAPRIDNLTMSEPTPGAAPTGRTIVRVLADRRALVIGVRCEDPDPAGIVSFTKARDSALQDEDHIKVVLDTFQDGRSGYVFAVNPGGARYDALVDPGGETENANWDGLWEAATSRDAEAGRSRSASPSRRCRSGRAPHPGTSTCSGASSVCRKSIAGRAGAATTRSRRRATPANWADCRSSIWESA